MTKKEAILLAAQEAFGQLGYSATTVKGVANRAGVSFGLVSHYFGSKQDLFLAAGYDMAQRLIATLETATANSESGIRAVETYMTTYFAFTMEERERFPILLRCSPFSHIEPGVDASKVAEQFRVFIDVLQSCVQRGMDDGTVIRKHTPEMAALIIYGNIVGAVRTNLLSPYDSGTIYAETVEHVIRSLRTDTAEQAETAQGEA
ncbi:TetR/AcrR family transcriptional regulator [Pseudodesulfovibrio tunisiensis]|uniref:TetR/AcrR family transcriptional regulator n=1 Tax=Pseudodesulfovibrio tunisiensis TaxID=463192 RepID=UPI001FB4A909|nr:TetR/AcrR family transcriptional regulator [Pseudodesulfovibrio tunisiensis]